MESRGRRNTCAKQRCRHVGMFESPQESYRRAESILQERAVLAIRPDDGRERALTTAALSAVVGVDQKHIATLHDISLSYSGRLGMEPHIVSSVSQAFKSLREFRQSFNRIPIAPDGEMATSEVAKVLLSLENSLEHSITDRLRAERISIAFRHAAVALVTSNRFIPIESAREIAAYVIGTAVEAALDSVASLDKSRHAEPPAPETLSPLASQDTLAALESILSNHRVEARAANLALRAEKDSDTDQDSSTSIPASGDVTLSLTSSESSPRSAPIHFVAAGRRAFLGVKLAAAHGLKDRIDTFSNEMTLSKLLAVRDAMRTWRAGEGVVVPAIEKPQEQASGTTEALGKNVFSISGASRQSVLRDVASGAVEWACRRYTSLQEEKRPEMLALVSELLSGLSRALQALTAREMLETLSVMSFPKEAQLTDGDSKWDVKTPFPFSRWLETKPLGRVLGTHEGDPFDQSTTIATLSDRKIQKVLSLLKTSSFLRCDLPFFSLTNAELVGLKSLSRWINALADRFEKGIPQLPSQRAMWVSEYDGGDGVTLPQETAKHFEEMQREHLVAQSSKESGFVEPETSAWLRAAIYNHDGFLLTINEGDPKKPLDKSEPEALLIVTCSQITPSPIMAELKLAAQSFLSRLPQTRTGAAPMVLAELAVVTTEGSALRREYGEVPLEVLVRQAEFNIISRFAEHERVDCLAICRKGSVALKAHKRYGYTETGATYTDHYGTAFEIIFKAVYPADVILGYRDITH